MTSSCVLCFVKDAIHLNEELRLVEIVTVSQCARVISPTTRKSDTF
jgi:nicotinamidase-related amidase